MASISSVSTIISPADGKWSKTLDHAAIIYSKNLV